MADHEDDTEKLLKNMKIPDYILMGHNPPNCSVDESPKWPLLVFINSKSGGQLGTHLLTSYRILLNPIQVFDLSEDMPDKVLHKVLSHLEKLIAQGDSMAADIRANLRIIAAGGDGTASWLLGVVGDLKLSHPPPIATVPLGTGNNLPYSFGWGKKNPGTDLDSVKSFLRKVSKAKPMNIDSWHVVMKMVISSDGPLEPIVLPHSMHSFRHVSDSDLLHEEGLQTFRGGFWNYFSLGMDAQVAYEFHHKRQEHPERFKSQLVNQGTYAMIGCTQGWFCANPFHPVSRNINQLGNIKVAKHKGPWKDLKISSRIRSIVMLNLPSFSGGLNPWGNPNDEKSKKRGLTAPYVNDGLIELVGFRDGWHGLALLGPNGHGTRLAQAHKVRIEFHKGDVDHTYMRMDGEPWLQPLPKGDAVTVIEITHLGQAVMLAAENCIAETLPHEAGKVYVCTEEGEHQVPTYHGGEGSAIELDQFADDGASSDSDTSSDSDSELKRKFGAADTSKSLSIDESIGS